MGSVGSGVVSETLEGGTRGPLSLDGGSTIGDHSIVIQVSLRSLDEGDGILAGALRAIGTSPVSVASASIIGSTSSMARAHVVALSRGIADE